MQTSKQLNAPIPGQSLMTEPKKFPYERPPEFVDPEDALEQHLERLVDPKRQEALLGMLDAGATVSMLTEGILRGAVANGVHTIDVSMIIGPVIHEFIKSTAKKAGVEFEEGLEDEQDPEQAEALISSKAERLMKRGTELPVIEEALPKVQEKPQGFMKRKK